MFIYVSFRAPNAHLRALRLEVQALALRGSFRNLLLYSVGSGVGSPIRRVKYHEGHLGGLTFPGSPLPGLAGTEFTESNNAEIVARCGCKLQGWLKKYHLLCTVGPHNYHICGSGLPLWFWW